MFLLILYKLNESQNSDMFGIPNDIPMVIIDSYYRHDLYHHVHRYDGQVVL